MATGRTIITIEHPETDLTLNLTNKAQVVEAVTRHLDGFASGALRFGSASVTVEQGGARAGGAVTLDTAGGEVFVTVAGAEVQVDGSNYNSDAETAVALADALNAVAAIGDVVAAEAVGSVVVLTARAAGAIGNLVTLSVLGNGADASGPALSGGTNPSGRALDY